MLCIIYLRVQTKTLGFKLYFLRIATVNYLASKSHLFIEQELVVEGTSLCLMILFTSLAILANNPLILLYDLRVP